MKMEIRLEVKNGYIELKAVLDWNIIPIVGMNIVRIIRKDWFINECITIKDVWFDARKNRHVVTLFTDERIKDIDKSCFLKDMKKAGFKYM